MWRLLSSCSAETRSLCATSSLLTLRSMPWMRTAAFNLRFASTLRRAIRCRMRHCIRSAAQEDGDSHRRSTGRDCILRRHTVLTTRSTCIRSAARSLRMPSTRTRANLPRAMHWIERAPWCCWQCVMNSMYLAGALARFYAGGFPLGGAASTAGRRWKKQTAREVVGRRTGSCPSRPRRPARGERT